MSIVDILLGLGLFSGPINLWKIDSDAVVKLPAISWILDNISRSDICGVDYDADTN